MAKYLALVAALCVALAVAAADEKKSDVKPEPARKAADTWEYAELHYSSTLDRGGLRGGMGGLGGGNGGPGGGGNKGGGLQQPAKMKAKVTVLWVTGDGETEGESWEDLAAKIKAPAAAKDAKPASHKVKLMNHLGKQGWELVSNDGNVWTFKRKAK